MVALIGAIGLVLVAVITTYNAREATRTNKELQGNGHGTMLSMVTDIHQEIGAIRQWQETHEVLHEGGLGSGQEQGP